MIGIYCIKNKENGKVYIGSSVDIQKRWNQHLRELRLGKHHSYKLQKDFKKYGESAFDFFVLKLCCRDTLIAEEQLAIENSRCVEKGYNVAPIAKRVTSKFENLFAQYPDIVTQFTDNISQVMVSDALFGCDVLALHSHTDSSPNAQLRRFVKASAIVKEVVEKSDTGCHYKLSRCNYLHGAYDYSLTPVKGDGVGGVETLLSRLFYEMEQSACGRALLKKVAS